MSQPVGDLVIDLSLDAVRFDEQMRRVRRHFSGLDLSLIHIWGQQVFRYRNSRYSLMLPGFWLKRTSTWPEVNDRPVFTGW